MMYNRIHALYLLVSLMLFSGLIHAQNVNSDQKEDERQGLHADGGMWGFKPSSETSDSISVLLIGDSILKGYYQNVSNGMKGVAIVDQWTTPRHLNSEPLLSELAENVKKRKYDVIHFNIGLHGWQEGRIPEGQYVPLLTKYVQTIRENAPQAKIIWASTTPVTLKDVAKLDAEVDRIIVERNQLAANVMNENHVGINDLYGRMVDKLELARLDRFHWNGEGYRLMADQIVSYIIRELDRLSDRIKIACVGNSITYGARIEKREQNCYPAQLASMLGEGYEVGNFGRNGATLLKKGNLPYWGTEQYQDALAYNPDWVLIQLGTNDTKPVNRKYLDENYINDYRDLINSFRELPSNPRVVLLLPLPVFSEDTTGITASVVTDNLIPMIRLLAHETGCEVGNLYNLMVDKPELLPDRVHPNAEGATVMARRLYDLIKMKSEPFDILAELPSAKTSFNFHGFEGYNFEFMGRKAKVVKPKQTAVGKPWVWRARFFGHEPQADIAVLERGFHIAYCDVAELFGNDESMEIWDGFYQLLTNAGLSQKSFMEGMSRGGVYIYRWASKYPERVNGVYADAPVLDLKSWPGGKGVGKGSPNVWQTFKEDYGFKSEEEALAFKGNPVDLAEQIAQTGIPMLHVVGDADDVVPVAENTKIFQERLNAAGGSINVIHKPGIGHHPHSLENPQPIVDFILHCSEYFTLQGSAAPAGY